MFKRGYLQCLQCLDWSIQLFIAFAMTKTRRRFSPKRRSPWRRRRKIRTLVIFGGLKHQVIGELRWSFIRFWMICSQSLDDFFWDFGWFFEVVRHEDGENRIPMTYNHHKKEIGITQKPSPATRSDLKPGKRWKFGHDDWLVVSNMNGWFSMSYEWDVIRNPWTNSSIIF